MALKIDGNLNTKFHKLIGADIYIGCFNLYNSHSLLEAEPGTELRRTGRSLGFGDTVCVFILRVNGQHLWAVCRAFLRQQ